MKALLVPACVALLVACGGGAPQPVPDLSEPEQESLCDEFVASICADPGFESFCTACVTTTGCGDAAAAGAITDECSPDQANGNEITDDDVRECADTRDFAVCATGGGCMFDALEAVCVN
jgi:hypothetical protein